MRYYKTVKDGYILQIGTNTSGMEITEEEYNEILTVVKAMPKAADGYGYKLRTNLTWEEYQIEPQPYEPTDEDKADGYDILMGVES